MALKLTQDAQTFLDGLLDRNRAIYGDLRMEADNGGDGDGGDGGDAPKDGDGKDGKDGGEGADGPKPTETVDYWKRRSRQNEAKAKENAEAAKRLAALEDAQKTAEERQTEAAEKARIETENLRIENLRLKAAGAHGVTGEDAELGIAYADLISGSDEESVAKSAEAIGRLVAAANELEAMRTGRKAPVTGSPRPHLKAGATPSGTPDKSSGAAGISEAERRFGVKQD